MVLKLDQEQSKTVYQLLAKRNLEQYQAEVEMLICGYLNPLTALKLILMLCEETERQTVQAMADRENNKLRQLLRKFPEIAAEVAIH